MIILIISLIILVLIGIPIAYSLGISGVLYFLVHHPDLLLVVPQRIFAGFNNPAMLALPLYLSMGLLMNSSGITAKLIDFCDLIVGRLKGGLGCVNVVTSMIFGGLSGSSAADTASVGAVLIPEMVKKGYDKKFAAGITVASSTMGVIIPPSIPVVIYCYIAEQSVGKTFLAGVIPGVLVAIFQTIMCIYLSYKRNYPVGKRNYAFKEKIIIIRNSLTALVLPFFVVGSIVMGVATVNESASFGVVYTLIVGFFIIKGLKVKMLPKIFFNAIRFSSTIMIIIATSQLYIWVLSLEMIPQKITALVLSLSLSPGSMLSVMMIIMLIVGSFMDLSPALILLTPVFLPAAVAMGISPTQFGSLLVASLAIGLVTPPVGVCLNIASAISKLGIIEIFEGAWPFLLCNVIVLLLICYIPAITLFIPSLFFH